MSEMQIFPETNVSLSLHVWNANIPRNKCEPISTCLKCIPTPKQMWAYLYMSEMHIFPETNVSLSLHVWNANIPRNKCEPISTCLKCIPTPKKTWAYLYMSEMQIFPETNVSLSLHVWNANIPRNKCEPISTCLKCIYSPKQISMWAYPDMSEMQIFPEKNVSLSLHVWNANVPRNKCEPISTCLKCKYSPKQIWSYLYMPDMHIFPETNVILSLYMSAMRTFPETHVSLSLHVWHAHICRNKCEPISLHVWHANIPRNTCEPSSICLKCIHTPKQTWAYLYMSEMFDIEDLNGSRWRPDGPSATPYVRRWVGTQLPREIFGTRRSNTADRRREQWRHLRRLRYFCVQAWHAGLVKGWVTGDWFNLLSQWGIYIYTYICIYYIYLYLYMHLYYCFYLSIHCSVRMYTVHAQWIPMVYDHLQYPVK